MTYSDLDIWVVIIALGIGTFLIRFSFLGIVGNRQMPDWVLRHLRYTPVAVLPGLVAPLVLWPEATGGSPDAARLAAAGVTILVAWWKKSVLWGAGAGFLTLAVLLNLL